MSSSQNIELIEGAREVVSLEIDEAEFELDAEGGVAVAGELDGGHGGEGDAGC